VKHQHKRQKADGSIATWEQTFTFGRTAQVFRRTCIQKRMIDDPRYVHLRSRKDNSVLRTGRADRKQTLSVKPDLDALRSRVFDASSSYVFT
jgi:hypothetical protein